MNPERRTRLPAGRAPTPRILRLLAVVGIAVGDEVVRPTAVAIREQRYPMVRELILITAGEPRDEVNEILRYTLSAEGQDIVRDLGYLPVRDGA